MRIVQSSALRSAGCACALGGLLLFTWVTGEIRAAESVDPGAWPVLPDYPPRVTNLAEYQARTLTGPFHRGAPAGYPRSDGKPVLLPSAVPAEMAEKGKVPDPFEISSRVPAPETIDLTGRDLSRKKCLSIGAPNRGRLVNGIPMRPFPGFLVRPTVHHVYGTPETIAALHYAVARVHQQFPGAHDLVVGDLSRRRGGRLPPHLSHQSGRDADVGFYHRNIDAPRSFVEATPANLDVERTWAFIEALLEDHKVEYIFIDYSIQRLLYRYVKYTLGAPEAYLRMVFSYPRRSRTAFIRHAPKHRDHLHVRFWSPIAVAAARGVTLTPADGRWFTPEEVAAYTRGGYVALNHFDRVDWGVGPGHALPDRSLYATYRVRSGDTLSTIAGRYHVSTAALMELNGLHARSIIRPGQRLLLPIRRSTTPAATGSSSVAVARTGDGGGPPGRTTQASGSGKDGEVWIYRVEPGDYPGKIARRFGVPVDRLLQANGLTRSSRIYPGQRLVVPADGRVSATTVATAEHQQGVGEENQAYRLVRRTSWVTVTRGDSLWSIARRHGTTVDRLCALNGLRRDSVLQVGQHLKAAEWYERVPVAPQPVLTSQPQPDVPAGR